MFAWLSSTYRLPPKLEDDVPGEDDLAGGQELPTAMKYRFLKNTAKDHVGVYRQGTKQCGGVYFLLYGILNTHSLKTRTSRVLYFLVFLPAGKAIKTMCKRCHFQL